MQRITTYWSRNIHGNKSWVRKSWIVISKLLEAQLTSLRVKTLGGHREKLHTFVSFTSRSSLSDSQSKISSCFRHGEGKGNHIEIHQSVLFSTRTICQSLTRGEGITQLQLPSSHPITLEGKSERNRDPLVRVTVQDRGWPVPESQNYRTRSLLPPLPFQNTTRNLFTAVPSTYDITSRFQPKITRHTKSFYFTFSYLFFWCSSFLYVDCSFWSVLFFFNIKTLLTRQV